jgi:hypothetical protein
MQTISIFDSEISFLPYLFVLWQNVRQSYLKLFLNEILGFSKVWVRVVSWTSVEFWFFFRDLRLRVLFGQPFLFADRNVIMDVICKEGLLKQRMARLFLLSYQTQHFFEFMSYFLSFLTSKEVSVLFQNRSPKWVV